MKKILMILFLLLLSLQAKLFALSVVYDSSGNVTNWGYQNTKQMEDQGYFVIYSKEDNPLLKLPKEHLCVRNGVLQKKTDEEIKLLTDQQRINEIKSECEMLLQDYQRKILLSKEGFDVSSDTATIQIKIESLKSEK